MTNRTMYDGVNSDAATIKRNFPDAEMVAGYMNGAYAWSAADWALFPDAVRVHISVSNENTGDVLDVENGDATPGQTAGWISQRKAAGVYRPTIYCNLSTVPAVRQGTGKYILGVDYDIWVADYDGLLADVYPGVAAKQYVSDSSWDLSVVYDAEWPHLKAPVPAPITTYPAPANLKTGNRGPHSAALTWSETAHGSLPAPEYQVYVYDVSSAGGPSKANLVRGYPRTGIKGLAYTGGSLSPGRSYVAHVVACGADGKDSRPGVYASVSFKTPQT